MKCPKCQKSLKLGDGLAGKRVRCPACQQPFVVPQPEPEPEELEAVEAEEEPVERAKPAAKSSRRKAEEEEEEEDRPRRSRRRDEEEEEEEEEEEARPRRSRRSRRRDDDDRGSSPVSSTPLVLAILACTCSCAPIIGAALGTWAMRKADEELAQLPRGKGFRDARKRLETARMIGMIGIILSVVIFIIALILNFTIPR
jgi:hypothetical protein